VGECSCEQVESDGFRWHAPTCQAGRLSPLARERVFRKMDEVQRARARAMADAHTAVVAGADEKEASGG
jgi:hypothetical protein